MNAAGDYYVPGNSISWHRLLCHSLVLLNTSQQSQKVGESERLSLNETSFGLPVLLTSGLIVQECDATEASYIAAARFIKNSYCTPVLIKERMF